MLLRGMEVNEKDILRNFLYEAIFIPEGVKPPDRSIIEQPELRIYYGNYSAPPLLRTLRVLRCGRTERFHRLSAPWNRSDPSDKQAYLTGS